MKFLLGISTVLLVWFLCKRHNKKYTFSDSPTGPDVLFNVYVTDMKNERSTILDSCLCSTFHEATQKAIEFQRTIDENKFSLIVHVQQVAVWNPYKVLREWDLCCKEECH